MPPKKNADKSSSKSVPKPTIDENLKPSSLKSKVHQPVKNVWTWKTEGSLIYGDCGTQPSSRIASFDMDDTLIKVKSGAKFAQDANDWQFWHPTKIAQVLRQLDEDGYKIVIFTNQNGISLGKTKASDIKTKIQNFSNQVGVKIHAFIASADDQYRKPSVAMWELLEKSNQGFKIDLKESFFCGDAAGRKTKEHKDFSNTDLLFAKNIGVSFKVPEVCFLGEQDVEIEVVGGFDGKTVPTTGSIFIDQKADSVPSVDKEMIIFCGSPGSGKSTFWQNYLVPHYYRINRDTLKTKQKCYKAAEEEMKKGRSVVIDNTTPRKQDRAYFIQLANRYNYKVRCFYFTTTKDICFHNDAIRSTTAKRQHLSGKAGKIAIHGWFKNLEEPKVNEGFYEVKKVAFVAKFNDDEDQKAYQSITKGK